MEAIVPLLGRLGVALEGTDRRGRTALHIAVASETSDPAALLTLLRAGATPEARTAEGCSAVELAVRAGSLRSIVALLQVGADANAPASLGFNASLGRCDEAPKRLYSGLDADARARAAAAEDYLLRLAETVPAPA